VKQTTRRSVVEPFLGGWGDAPLSGVRTSCAGVRSISGLRLSRSQRARQEGSHGLFPPRSRHTLCQTSRNMDLPAPVPVPLGAQWLLYIPTTLTCRNCTFCPDSACVPYGSHMSPVRYGLYLCVPYGSHSKQRLFPHTAFTGWAL
jgi:hypothetical protein